VQVIRAGRLIDGTGAEVQRDRALYVEDGRIVEVRPGSQTPTNGEVLDLSQLTVLPGLFDLHVHLVFSAGERPLRDVEVESDQRLLLRAVAAARQALSAGVTTVRDLGGRGDVTFVLRDAINDGLLSGPRVLAAGSPITITGGHCHFLGLEADGEVAVRAAARRQLKAGANCLKIMSTGGRMTPGTNINVAQYSVAEIAAAVEEARRRHVTIAAHSLGVAGLRNAVAAGVDTIEHFNWLDAEGGVEFDPDVARQMVRQGTGAVLTLVPLRRASAELRAQIVGAMREAFSLGVMVLAGTDAGVALTPFDSLPRELELMVTEIGLTPTQAIVAATSAPARVLGLSDEVGTLAPGQMADLLAVEGDPSQQIEDLRRVRLVLQAGQTVVQDGVVVR